ncbi:aminoacyl-tRNA hydrolase [Rhodococcus sp. 15-725-2-2b]|jgi:PTH1 family peptidyl-tRNA hydrolase|nr:aminoacyl-tRNA hydrolase [Rhodococcus sp. 06-470-2]OZC72606.1 aminoacyl-tRNA hydrolase [Rhodococcus sp. 06-469-3-2]OZC76902.1 aminoacyl-tRNA hydrolase [Rhodococcus sp. 06-418-5]OZD48832.1 aminoacyl-tRNA hydrolase [Rhodococcus sp. 06-1477-1A]OZD81414.1 aminoacyl-tRNA hydrolase [Rhodococcus sp. 05-339-2]OZE03276.1 aminoacyl-tRNA hydrolase [Rhodococcus sp. 05-2255-3C]OZE09664.1 aminoacyl-tRNA hydrolase [Rhodococcus sp. 05-2255-3B1]OZE14931.1 aminoacyl-tRNA hydrolase [Rhodococcus sp. 05-2255-
MTTVSVDPAAPALIVGLGNPGPQYEKTRHNVGFMVADALAGRIGSAFSSHKKSNSDIVQARLGSRSVVIAKPRTFMNLSGQPVAALARFFSIEPANIVVVHDELDIDFGALRLKLGGGEGGHNGLRSISQHLSTKDYLRVRVGVGRPPGRMDPASFVLKPFSAAERKDLGVVVEEAADAAELLLSAGLEAAQNTVHPR